MQERTLYQEIVKQCMIQERHDALLESDKEKGIERTEETELWEENKKYLNYLMPIVQEPAT